MQIEVSQLKLEMGDFSLSVPHWSLPEASHLLIEGPSGSGKTTFLHLLAGLIPVTQGRISIGQTSMDLLSENLKADFRRRNLGLIFQKIHLLPHLTLLENILLGAQNSEQARTAKDLARDLNLSHRLQHIPSTLSLGETQRAAVIRALISYPPIIFADEPTSGLDEMNADKVMNLLVEKTKGKTLIVVSHDSRAQKYFKNKINFKELTQ